MVQAVRRALVQPFLLQRRQVEAVEERPVPVWRRPVAAQVDHRAVLQHGMAAVGIGRHQRRARVGIGVVHGMVEQDPAPLRIGQVAHPGGQPPAITVVLGQQHLVRLVQVEPAETAVLHIEHALRLPGKRRLQPHHAVPVLRRSHRVAAVQGLGPEQRGRGPLLPGHLPRAGRHSLPRDLVADAELGDDALHFALGRPDLDAPREVLVWDPERERPPHPVHQKVLAVRGVGQPLVQPWRPEFLHRPGAGLDPERNRGGQRLERVRVGGGPQQILVGRHLRPLACGLLDARLERRLGHPAHLPWGAERKQRAAVAGPPDRGANGQRVAAEHIADPQPGHLPRRRRLGVGHPHPDAVGLVHGEHERAAVGRPRRNARLRPVRQGHGPLGPVGQPEHRKAGQPAHPLPPGQHRVQAYSGQPQVAALQQGDRRMRLVVDEGDEPSARRQQRHRSRRRIDDRDDVAFRDLVGHCDPLGTWPRSRGPRRGSPAHGPV